MHYMRTMYWSCRSIFTHSFWRYEAIFVALLIILMTAGHSTIFCRTNHFPALTRGLSSISLSVTFRGYSLVCLDTKQSLSIILMVALIAGHFLSPGTEPFQLLLVGYRRYHYRSLSEGTRRFDLIYIHPSNIQKYLLYFLNFPPTHGLK